MVLPEFEPRQPAPEAKFPPSACQFIWKVEELDHILSEVASRPRFEELVMQYLRVRMNCLQLGLPHAPLFHMECGSR